MYRIVCYKFIDLHIPHQICDVFEVPEIETAREIADNYEAINLNTVCEIERI